MSARRPRRRRAAPELPPQPEEWAVAEDDDPHLTRVEGPRALSGELSRLTRRPGWGERLSAARLVAAWPAIVGPDLVAHCEPVRLAGRVLVVRAATPVWATQLRYLTQQLVERADEVLGVGSVTKVDVVVGRLEGAAAPPAAGQPGAAGEGLWHTGPATGGRSPEGPAAEDLR